MKDILQVIQSLPADDQRWLLGNDTQHPLTDAFDYKRVVHAGMGGRTIVNDQEKMELWESLMSQSHSGGPRTAYIHIPFCERKCNYCGFFQNASQRDILTQYTDAVIDELRLTSQYERAKTGSIQAVYFGGGTPSTLSAKDIYRLTEAVHQYLPLANDCEITLESRIHDMTDEKVAAAIDAGINRFSLGVQSFNTKIRQAIGRIDDEHTVVRTLKRMLDMDRATIVIDLMFGLPYQTWGTWEHDLRTQFKLGLHGGDMYQLNVFPESDLAKAIHQGTLPPAMPTKAQAQLYGRTLSLIQDEYPAIDVFDPSHWASSRRERSIYNTLAKASTDMLHFGSSAGGVLNTVSMMNYRDLSQYMEHMKAGRKPLMVMIDEGNNGLFIRDLKSQLEASYLDNRFFIDRWKRSIFDWLYPVLDVWQEKGLVTVTNQVMRFTTAGKFWHDNLIQAVLECMSFQEETVVKERMTERTIHMREAEMHPHMARMMGMLKEGKLTEDMIAMAEAMMGDAIPTEMQEALDTARQQLQSNKGPVLRMDQVADQDR